MTAKFPDISETYTPDRALQEEVSWLLDRPQEAHAKLLLPRLEKYGIKSVLEVGCGSGILASLLPKGMVYLGVDKNLWMVRKALTRNMARQETMNFVQADVRELEAPPGDLAMCWSFLKHFSLDEWDQIVAKVLAHGKYGCLEVQITDQDIDNGTEWHHVFVTRERLQGAIAAAGHMILEQETHSHFALPTGEGCSC